MKLSVAAANLDIAGPCGRRPSSNCVSNSNDSKEHRTLNSKRMTQDGSNGTQLSTFKMPQTSCVRATKVNQVSMDSTQGLGVGSFDLPSPSLFDGDTQTLRMSSSEEKCMGKLVEVLTDEDSILERLKQDSCHSLGTFSAFSFDNITNNNNEPALPPAKPQGKEKENFTISAPSQGNGLKDIVSNNQGRSQGPWVHTKSRSKPKSNGWSLFRLMLRIERERGVEFTDIVDFFNYHQEYLLGCKNRRPHRRNGAPAPRNRRQVAARFVTIQQDDDAAKYAALSSSEKRACQWYAHFFGNYDIEDEDTK